MLQTRKEVFRIDPKCLKMSQIVQSDASLSERTCLKIFQQYITDYSSSSPLSESVTEELWVLTEKHALDLGALNTQRGRDHALRSYLDYRR